MPTIALKPKKPIKEPHFRIAETPNGYWKIYGGNNRNEQFSEYRSHAEVFGRPLVSIVKGNDPRTGRMGVADGVIAIGQRARGFIAIGQFCNGQFISVGQFCTSRFFALGQFAVAPIAVGQGVLGVIAIGQFASGLIGIGQMGIAGIGQFMEGIDLFSVFS